MAKKNRRGGGAGQGRESEDAIKAAATAAQAVSAPPGNPDDDDDGPEITIDASNVPQPVGAEATAPSPSPLHVVDDAASVVVTAEAAAPARPTVTISPALEPIVERLRAGRCVLCAGAGLESAVGMVTFREMLEQLLGQLAPSPEVTEARKVLEHRPFVTAGFVRRRLGDRFSYLLQGASQSPSQLPETIKLLGELPFRSVLTTSYSDLFSRAFTKNGTPPPVYTPADVPGLKRDSRNRFVLMALGDPARPETVLFTSQEVQTALAAEAYRGVIHDVYRHRSIVFIGYSAGDLENFFGRLFAGAHSDQTHYAIIPGLSSVEAEELEATFRIKAITTEPDLLALVKQVREAIGDFDAEAPPDDGDLEGWLDVYSQEPERADARDKLAAIEKQLTAAADYERLLELHLGLAEIERPPSVRASHLREVARLFEEQIGDLGKAFTALIAAYKEDPSDARVASELERLAAATGQWAELLQEYTDIVPGLQPRTRGEHWLRVAKLYGDKLGHDEYALAALGEALEAEPKLVEAEELRLEYLRKSEKWKQLTDALGTRAAHEEVASRKAELYLEQGDVFESRLSDGPSAVIAYHAALDADPGSADALNALEHLHRRRGEHKELVAVLDRKVERGLVEDATATRKEAAAIAADKLGNRASAISRYEQLRVEDDRDLAVLKALEALYDAENRIDDYFEVLAAQADALKDDREKLVLYRRLGAEWEERPNGATRAAEYYERVLAIEPRSEDALRSVEKLYAVDKKWEALVDAYRRHAELPGADKALLASYIGQIFESEVGDAPRAIQAWQQVVELQPSNDDALAALVRLERKLENWAQVLELLDKRAELARDKDAKVALLHDAATIALEQLGDSRLAESRLNKTLGIEPTHVASMLALVELYRKSGEFLRAAKLLVEAEQHTQNRLEKTRILVEAGEIYESLEEKHVAADHYLKALAVDPEHVEAGTRVAELLWSAERWADLVPVLEMLTRKEADKEVQKQRWDRLGRAALKTGQKDKAIRAYGKASEIEPTDLEAQRGRGELLFADGKWKDARDAFGAVLHHHRDDLAGKELVELFFTLGECARHLAEVDKAKNYYAKALEIDPTHRPTILAQIDVGTDDPKSLIENKKALLATASSDERVQLLSQIGDLQLEKLHAPGEAIATWREALGLKPDSRQLLHKCLDVFVEQKDWREALAMLEKLTDLEQSVPVRAKLRFARAMIHKDELKESEAAIRLLGETLDDDADHATAAKELEDLLTATENWKDLARYYRRAIKKIGPETESDSAETRKERLRLWSTLADVMLEKLGDRMAALAALEVTATLERGNPKRQELLAELYLEAGPDHLDKAIAAQQTLLRAQHDRISSYRALRALYGQANKKEQALACAYALSILKKGDPDDAAMINEAKQRPLQPVRRNLDDDNWLRNVAHPDEDRYVDALFTQLMPVIALSNGKPHKDAGFNRKEKLEPMDPRSFAKAMRYVAVALDAKLAYEGYVKYDQRAAISITNCVDKQQAIPCVAVGQPLLGEHRRTERELIFEFAKQLCYLRPERYLRYVLPSATALGQIIDTAIGLAIETDGGKPVGEALKMGQELKRALQPKVLEQVVFFGRKLRGQKGEQLAQAWLAATELSATRAAFLLLGDLEQTARLAAGEPPAVSPHPPTYRLKELIWFSVTEECFAARRHLGLMA